MSSKKSLTFVEFNDIVNKDDIECYIELKDKIPIRPKPFKPLAFNEIQELAKKNSELEIGWVISPGYIVIDIDDKVTADIVLKIIESREEKVLVCKTNRGIHVYAKSLYNKKTTNNILAVGAFADTIVSSKGGSYIVTPFKHPKNKSDALKNRKVIYYNGIEELPFWLTPIFNSSKNKTDAIINFPHRDARNDSFNRHLWRLKSVRNLVDKQREEIIHIINDFVAEDPLSDTELYDTLLRAENNMDLPEKEFFNENKTFLHNKLGEFLVAYLNIKKGESGKIYHYNERKGVYESNEDYLKGQMTTIIPYLKEHQKNEVIHYLNSKLELDKVTFNENPYTIVFKNGVLDLVTFEFKEHSPIYLETIQLNVNFNPEASSKTVDEFFDTATIGNKELETLLYEAMGYSFLKTVELASCFILTGGGRNGKSTFLDLIKEIVGKNNSTSVDFKELGKNFGVGGLANKLVSLAGDISNQRIGESDMFKKIVSGDLVRVDEKYEKKYDTVLFSTLFFSANDLPRTPDTSDGFYRRLMIIPFNANLDKVNRVEGMKFKTKLLSTEGLEYAAYNAVLAIKKVLDNTCDFTEPDVVKEEKRKYRILNSSVLTWAMEVDRDLTKKPISELYLGYDIWAENNGFKPVGRARFDKELANEFGLKINDGKFVEG